MKELLEEEEIIKDRRLLNAISEALEEPTYLKFLEKVKIAKEEYGRYF